MSPFWSAWIMGLVVFNLGVTLFLFIWGQRVRIPVLPDGTSGHVWAHGTLREGVRKLPLPWILLSATMFISGITYLVLYPGFGGSKGLLGWTAVGELAHDTDANQAKLEPLLHRFANETVEQLAFDPAATSMGARLYIDNCSACHGRAGYGNPKLGAPNLTDNDWLYGGSGETILKSILDGRHGVMPQFGAAFDQTKIEDLANYVHSLSDIAYSREKADAGKPLFAVCAACHGADGKGNQTIGAPNLTGHIWLYGSDDATISETIRNGRSGVMPAWRGRLSDNDARLIAAWVFAQSHLHAPERPDSAAP